LGHVQRKSAATSVGKKNLKPFLKTKGKVGKLKRFRGGHGSRVCMKRRGAHNWGRSKDRKGVFLALVEQSAKHGA